MRIEPSGDYAWRTDLDESRRAQVEHYLAITQYTMFKDDEGIDVGDLRWDKIEWTDVAERDV